MSDATSTTNTQPANADDISLAQAILAPLDAIFQAQIHAARSYINLLWQMAYPHIPIDKNGAQVEFKAAYDDSANQGNYVFELKDGSFAKIAEDGTLTTVDNYLPDPANFVDLHMPYTFPLTFQTNSNNEVRDYLMKIPVVAMIPTSPLAIEEANIKFSMAISSVGDNQQQQDSEIKKFGGSADGGDFDESTRPWYLVKKPKSINGSITSSNSNSSSIDISIKLTKSPVPAALEKSLTVLTQSIGLANLDRKTTN